MDSLLYTWTKIVKETEKSQVLQDQNKGLIHNFLINGFYYRETAFAAKIFAAEYLRTNNEFYLNKSRLALDALKRVLKCISISQGIDEPMITPRGIKYRKGSIPATILLLISAIEAADYISYCFEFDVKGIVDYLEKCYLGNGRFYHDVVEPNKKCPHVINATAMVYCFLEMVKKSGHITSFYKQEINNIKRCILSSSRGDGFYPYLEPQTWQRGFYIISKLLPIPLIFKIYNRLLSDSSIFFGDAIHHLICIYYYCKGRKQANDNLNQIEMKRIRKSWAFIKQKLREYQNGFILFDFSWEPKPTSYRHCNFIDTSTYFYIIDLLLILQDLKIIDAEESNYYLNGIAKHIEKKLLKGGEEIPVIRPYEGDEFIVDRILPRPSESVFDKGYLIADTIVKLYGK